ncbi:hypothetical protein [Micromonospora tarapacensis]|uniref:hypothetical protein n=1 Tax=Micromonospora tarapacensis TaxID=2835305 RepID=UPI002F3EF51D
MTEPVAEGAAAVLRVGQKGEVALGEPEHLLGRLRLAAGDDQAASDVVGAVAVLTANDGVPGVLEQAGVVAQPAQVREARTGHGGPGFAVRRAGAAGGRGHADAALTAGRRAATSRSASVP